MAKFKVLSTKKLEPALVEQAKQNEIEIVEQEFISVNPILSKEKYDEVMTWVLSRNLTLIVFTSSNAIESLETFLHQCATWFIPNWKFFCLSGRTKETLLNATALKKEIIDTAENASALAQKIIEHGVKAIVFFCGDKRRDELPNLLKNAGITVHEVVVYETVEAPSVTTDSYDGILFFSPSAVNSFFSINHLPKNTICFAIGKTTAYSIAEFTDNKIIISQYPGQELMMETVNEYLKKFYERIEK